MLIRRSFIVKVRNFELPSRDLSSRGEGAKHVVLQGRGIGSSFGDISLLRLFLQTRSVTAEFE